MTEKTFCPRCMEDDTIKSGFAYRIGGKQQRYMCKRCGHAFIPKVIFNTTNNI